MDKLSTGTNIFIREKILIAIIQIPPAIIQIIMIH